MKSAVIIRTDHIGDLVLTTPMIRALSNAGWSVDIIAPKAPLSLLQHDPRIRQLTALEEIAPSWPRGWWRIAQHLRRRKYGAVILPYAHPRQILLATALSGARYRIAMWGGIPARLTGHMCVRSGYFDEPRPYARTILRALGPLGISADEIEPNLVLTAEELSAAAGLLDTHLSPGIHVGIHPLCLGNTCNLPPETYESLAQLILARTPWNIVVTGTEDDRARLPLMKSLATSHPGRVWIGLGKFTLRQLSAIISKLDAYVVPSTGPLHLARAVNVPTITPFCPQIPVCASIWGHAPLSSSAVQPATPPCDPLARHAQHCDFRGTITAEDLFQQLSQAIEGRSKTSLSAATP